MTRIYVWGLALVAALVVFFLVRSQMEQSAHWDAVDTQLTQETVKLVKERTKDRVLVAGAKRRIAEVDSSQLPKVERQKRLRSSVAVYNDTAVAIKHTDGEISVVTVPPEVVQLILADSIALQAQELRLTARDTALVKLDTLAAIDDRLIVHKDSVETHLRDRPGTPLWKKAGGAVVAGGLIIEVLRLLLRR